MKPDEARVFIIEDDTKKLGYLTDFIEANGGQVVGTIDNREDAHGAIGDADFPASIGNANTVLIDGNLDKYGGHGTDGQYIFLDGYKRGPLHRVDAPEGIGAVALGCSIDSDSAVAYATGGNLNEEYRKDAPARWAALLEPHPSEPLYLSEGTLERMDFSGGFQFGEMLEHVFRGNPTVTLHALSITEIKKDGEEEVVTYSDELTTPTDSSIEELIVKAGGGQATETSYMNVDSHMVKAIVQTDDHIHVIDHTSRIVNSTWGSNLTHYGKTDKIAIAGLSEIPDTYWESLGLERPSISGSITN